MNIMKVKLPDGTEVDVDMPEGMYTAEDLERIRREAMEQARKEERDKLYPQRDKEKERFDAMAAEVKALREAEQTREREAAKRAAEVEKAKKAAADAELSAKELLEQRQAEWNAQLEATRQESASQIAQLRADQEQRDALFEKERTFQALQIYIRDQAAAHANDIAPELIDLIDGNTPEEVDASVARMVEKTAQIVAGMRQAAQAHRAAMPGVSPGGGTAGIVPGLDTGDKVLGPEDIKGMSMKDFAALRQTVGLAGRGQGQGIFG
jgi:hypothetical protein